MLSIFFMSHIRNTITGKSAGSATITFTCNGETAGTGKSLTATYGVTVKQETITLQPWVHITLSKASGGGNGYIQGTSIVVSATAGITNAPNQSWATCTINVSGEFEFEMYNGYDYTAQKILGDWQPTVSFTVQPYAIYEDTGSQTMTMPKTAVVSGVSYDVTGCFRHEDSAKGTITSKGTLPDGYVWGSLAYTYHVDGY